MHATASLAGRASVRPARPARAEATEVPPRAEPRVSRRELGAGLAGVGLSLVAPRVSFAEEAAVGGGRVALVTGANTGIGYETALGLARQGFAPLLACRTVEKAKAAAARIQAAVPGARVRVLDAPLELTSLQSVAAYADAVLRSDAQPAVVIANAGIMAAPRGQTTDGHELHHGVNHLGHFALVNALLPALRDAGTDARVVHVSSIAAYGAGFDVADLDWTSRQYERWSAYCASKRENVLFSDALAEREAAVGSSVSSVSLHPGVVDTELVRYVVPPDWLAARATADQSRSQLATTLTHLLGVRSAPEGAAPSLWAATAPRDAYISGGYYLDAAQLAPAFGRPGGGAGGKALRDELWERSEAAVADSAAGRVRVSRA